ncbi:MAG: lasso peptide biosynthesis B2 protein [Lysobacterales bacterium]
MANSPAPAITTLLTDTAPPSRLARWRRLPTAERRLVARVLLLLPLVDLSLRLLGFQRTWRWMARWARPLPSGLADPGIEPTPRRIADLARAVGAGSLWPTTCLRQALVVWLLLRRRGLQPELKIGVVSKDPPLQAHAWVEVDGKALDPDISGHAVFPRIEPPASVPRDRQS